jgi:hypothetical protein
MKMHFQYLYFKKIKNILGPIKVMFIIYTFVPNI